MGFSVGGPIGAAVGGLAGLLFGGQNKPTEYTMPMTKEDQAKRKIWLNYIQNKIYNEPNRGQQSAGSSLDLLNSIYGRGMQGNGGMQAGGMPQQGMGMSPYGGMQGMQNPYMNLFRQGAANRPGMGGGMPPTLQRQQSGMRMG
jgi:hypothetical protein